MLMMPSVLWMQARMDGEWSFLVVLVAEVDLEDEVVMIWSATSVESLATLLVSAGYALVPEGLELEAGGAVGALGIDVVPAMDACKLSA
jgi:hypothetical protein